MKLDHDPLFYSLDAIFYSIGAILQLAMRNIRGSVCCPIRFSLSLRRDKLKVCRTISSKLTRHLLLISLVYSPFRIYDPR
jgi:hypothetical protein